MPIPNRFILNAHDESGFAFFLADAFTAMRIKISPYRGVYNAPFTRLAEREKGGLVIEEVQNSIRTDIRITRIHNRKQEVVVYGGTDELLDTLVHGCLERRRDELIGE